MIRLAHFFTGAKALTVEWNFENVLDVICKSRWVVERLLSTHKHRELYPLLSLKGQMARKWKEFMALFSRELMDIQRDTAREIALQEEVERQRLQELQAKREAEGETKREIQRMRMRLAGLNFLEEEKKSEQAPDPTNKENAYQSDQLNMKAYRMMMKTLIGINSVTIVSGELLISSTFVGFDFVDILPNLDDLEDLERQSQK